MIGADARLAARGPTMLLSVAIFRLDMIDPDGQADEFDGSLAVPGAEQGVAFAVSPGPSTQRCRLTW